MGVVRWFAGVLFLPACWALVRTLLDMLVIISGQPNAFSAESVSLLGGMAAFALCWAALSHPVRAYVLGHELTHALWGLVFGARPSGLRVSASGGSVQLSKSNFIITLAPYFFPFYTFVVIVAALITYAFLRPLPCLPLWMFLVGFTWAFHVLFTVETLVQRQPDVTLYGRLFSWTLILNANVLLVLGWLVLTTDCTFVELGAKLWTRLLGAYLGVADVVAWLWGKARGWIK